MGKTLCMQHKSSKACRHNGIENRSYLTEEPIHQQLKLQIKTQDGASGGNTLHKDTTDGKSMKTRLLDQCQKMQVCLQKFQAQSEKLMFETIVHSKFSCDLKTYSTFQGNFQLLVEMFCTLL